MKGRLSQFIYHFLQVMKVLQKHLLASSIISPMKNASLMLFELKESAVNVSITG